MVLNCKKYFKMLNNFESISMKIWEILQKILKKFLGKFEKKKINYKKQKKYD